MYIIGLDMLAGLEVLNRHEGGVTNRDSGAVANRVQEGKERQRGKGRDGEQRKHMRG